VAVCSVLCYSRYHIILVIIIYYNLIKHIIYIACLEGSQQPGQTQSHCRWLHPARGDDSLDTHRVAADDSTGYNFPRGGDSLDTHTESLQMTLLATTSRGEATAWTHIESQQMAPPPSSEGRRQLGQTQSYCR
jgi:hypothetical protein